VAGQDGVGASSAVSRTRAVLRFIGRSGRRIGITIAGLALLVAGGLLLVLPGPGWVTIFAGLAVLSMEYTWARRLLDRAKTRAKWAAERVRRRKNPPGEGTSTPQP
jgi:uncharacterized protein (TIGR02611 family)